MRGGEELEISRGEGKWVEGKKKGLNKQLGKEKTDRQRDENNVETGRGEDSRRDRKEKA